MNIEEIKTLIEFVENLDTDSISIEEIKNIINPILQSVFFTSPLIDQSQSLFRSVNIENTKPQKYENIIYPPKEILKNHQRLNAPHCPVFYCSTSKHCCVYEGRYRVGDLIAISEWEVLNDKNLTTSNIGYTDYLNKWSEREIPDWHKDSKIIIGKTKEQIEKNYIVLDFMSRLFCKNYDDDNSKYKITIAISNLLSFNSESETVFEKIEEQKFRGENAIEAILYPSILTIAKSDNLAIRRFTFHKKIKFVSVEYVKITSIDENDFSFETIDFANNFDANNDILWKGRPGNFILPPEIEVKLQQTSENNYSLIRTDGGKLYKN